MFRMKSGGCVLRSRLSRERPVGQPFIARRSRPRIPRGTTGFARSCETARLYVRIARQLRSPMPEGPSLVILRELAHSFAGQRILRAEGNSKIDKTRLV